jgi:prophage antirepressor-like protein
MNALARLVSLSFYLPSGGFPEKYRIVDRDGNPWAVLKDVCKILGIKNPSKAVKNFPKDEKSYVVAAVHSIHGTSEVTSNDATSVDVPGIEYLSHDPRCDITSGYITSAKSRARKTQRVLIISEAGLFRLITRSDKPIARRLQDVFFKEVFPAYRKHGISWASLPRIWKYRGQLYNYPEWRGKKQEAYFKRFPNATMDDFYNTLPPGMP